MSREDAHIVPAAAPVTWLASYPRSGNTLLRLILKHCFGLSSQSLYQDQDFADPDVCTMVGHEEIGANARQFVTIARRAGRSLYVKTHEPPAADQHPAIYVVRDGRSAVVSHTHYLREVLHRDVSLSDVITGKTGQSWSQHVRAWVLPLRANTLVVHYEDLAAARQDVLAQIATFIGRPLQRGFDLSFDHLHALHPAFFSGVDLMRPISQRWIAHPAACSTSITGTCCGRWAMAVARERQKPRLRPISRTVLTHWRRAPLSGRSAWSARKSS